MLCGLRIPQCVHVVLLQVGADLGYQNRNAPNDRVNRTTVIANEVAFLNPSSVLIAFEYVEIQRVEAHLLLDAQRTLR